ncbi:MAG: hypothetical protein ACI93R_003685 [Flavobacteriales bacterium]
MEPPSDKAEYSDMPTHAPTVAPAGSGFSMNDKENLVIFDTVPFYTVPLNTVPLNSIPIYIVHAGMSRVGCIFRHTKI